MKIEVGIVTNLQGKNRQIQTKCLQEEFHSRGKCRYYSFGESQTELKAIDLNPKTIHVAIYPTSDNRQ